LSCSGRYIRNTSYGLTSAPVKKVSFSNPLDPTRPVEQEALLDSGASGTLIPRSVANELGLQISKMAKTYDYQRKFTGLKPVYVVTVSCDSMINNVEAIETNGSAIIGRDILNTIKFTLDARRNNWEMS